MRNRVLIAHADMMILLMAFLTSCMGSGGTQRASFPNPVGGRLILLVNERQAEGNTLLKLVRVRLPVLVASGRFTTEDGVTDTCLYGHRGGGPARLAGGDPAVLPFCPMIVTYVDGVRISDPASFLAIARADEFESVELASASGAMQRDGISVAGSEVLIVWTRGRGPYARW